MGQGNDVSGAIAALLSASRQQPRQVTGPAAPAYAARAALPQGYVPPSSGGSSVAQAPDVSALLDAVRTPVRGSGGSDPGSAGGVVYTGSGGASGGGGGARAGSGRAPVATSGPLKLIGTPYTGTHTLGNWQSDRAYDIGVPKGTPMVALQDGQVVKVTKHPQGAGRFAGDQITIRGKNGNEYFYAHGIASVQPGQRIRKGQQLGVTGSANGVEHLHFAQERGDPSMHLRRR
jgi:murein DD-endopeptidase MepM/ murein hydrolase activator NlpD